MRPSRGFGIALVLLLCPQLAQAQDSPPFDPAIDVQLFEYATGRHTFLTVADADVQAHKQFSLDLILTFITDPFVVHNVDENEDEIIGTRTNVVQSVMAGEIGGAIGFKNKFELGVALPVVFRMTGQGLTPETAGPAMDPLEVAGLGDLRIELKWLAWRSERVSFALIPGLTVPTSVGSGGGDFLGDDTPSGRGRAALQWTDEGGQLSLGVNAGVLFRKPRQIYNSEVGQQLTYGAGASFKATESFAIVAELFGRAGLFNVDLDASPLEAAAGVRVRAGRSFSVLAGGGTGLVKGIGSPGARFFVSLGWAPDYRDEDGDGISNANDKCPLLPEDKDGFEDSDGCPDDDNDGDKREDSIDKCPNEAEDLDGFEDDDGCPEADNDKDGILDADDRCPVDAEDKVPPYDTDGCPANKRDSDDDGVFDADDKCPDEGEDIDDFEDWDGCPDVDNDGDDIPDEFDQCPLCKEDIDGFDDDDGCPEVDNDGDGIDDDKDACPSEAETINGENDFDGCPDDGEQAVSLDGDRVQINDDIQFRRGKLTSKGRAVADQLALVMKTNPDVVSWRIVVAAPRERNDEATRLESQSRADALKAHAVMRGVSEARIEAIGAVSDNPTIAVVVRERSAPVEGEAPFCPVQFRAVAREPSAARAPAPAMTVEPTNDDPDGDGVVGAADQCPDDAEDRDGFEDTDGCPDEDNDDDGVPDASDKCPNKPETANGYQDDDGCPDNVPAAVKKFSGRIEGIKFETGSATIASESFPILDEAAKVIASSKLYIEVQGHTDNKGSSRKNTVLSQQRADAVKAYMASKGVGADHITAIGFGPTKPVANNRTEAGRSENRRVEFRLVGDAERKEKAAMARAPSAFKRYSGVAKKLAFKNDAPLLSSSATRELDKITKLMLANDGVTIVIEVHTDDTLDAAQSKTVTTAQAEAVAAYLIDAGVDRRRIKARGKGLEFPIASGSKNRRVELRFLAD